MKVNYYVAFKLDGTWTEDYFFKRGLFSDAPLDESLDTGIVVDVPCSLKKIPPFTLCRISVKDTSGNSIAGVDPEYYFTGDRQAEAVTLFRNDGETISQTLSRQTFTQKINLIELTKILERVPCDSLSFTHRLRKDVEPFSRYIEPVCHYYRKVPNGDTWVERTESQMRLDNIIMDIDAWNTSYFEGYYNTDTISIKGLIVKYYRESDGQTVSPTYTGAAAVLSPVSGGTVYPAINYTSTVGNYSNNSTVIDTETPEIGNYTLTYTLEFNTPTLFSTNYYRVSITYQFFVAENTAMAEKPIPSISKVISRILSVGSPRPVYKPREYKLDSEIFSQFAGVKAPEFFFPRMTLFEALLEVGKKIHGMPRLTVDTDTSSETYEEPCKITYDLLGLDEEYSFPENARLIGYKNTHGAEDYCGALDSYAENYINTIDPNAGTVTEPFEGGYKTLRCESGVKITNKTAVFEATRPIYRVVKFEMAYTGASASMQEPTVIGDITNYLYEQAEYDGLYASSSYVYPNSIAYALVWKQGDRFIRGFNTTSESLLNFLQSFEEPAIRNIVSHFKGNGYIDANQLYSNLAFRLTYIPMDNLRLRQYKPYATHPNNNVLYNQQNANTVEGSFYGEGLKGKIARMGNEIEVYTLRFQSPADLPKIGQTLADNGDAKGYIYKVTKRGERDDTVADIYVTPDFNRLSEYFSLESNFRLFEVSERQSIDRQVIVPRIIKVSLSAIDVPDEPRMFDSVAVNLFMNTFTGGVWEGTNGRANVAVVRLIKDGQSNYEQIGDNCYCFPVNSTSCGNSLAFSFGFMDSFSAGNRSEEGGYDSSTQGQILWKQRKNSQYGDEYGEFWGMEFSIASTLCRPATIGQSVWGLPYVPEYSDQSTAGGFDDSLPTISNDVYKWTTKYSQISTKTLLQIRDETPPSLNETSIRVVDKNSSEHISVVVQFHGQATDKKIVFGSAMWNKNLLIRDDVPDHAPLVYGLTSGRLNMLRNKIDLTANNVVQFRSYMTIKPTVNVPADAFYQASIDPMPVTFLESATKITAWFIADPDSGELYIGVNETKNKGETTSPIYFTFDQEA